MCSMGANGSRATWPLLPALLFLIAVQGGKQTDVVQEADHLSDVKNMLQDIKANIGNLKEAMHFEQWSTLIDHQIENLTRGIQDLNAKFSNITKSTETMENLFNKMEKRLETRDSITFLHHLHPNLASSGSPRSDKKDFNVDVQTTLQILIPKLDKLLQSMEGVESQLWKSPLESKLDDAISLIRKLMRRPNACKDRSSNNKMFAEDSEAADSNVPKPTSANEQEEQSCHEICKQYTMQTFRNLVELKLVKALLHPVGVDPTPAMSTAPTSEQMQKDSPFEDDFDEDDLVDDDDLLYDQFFRIQASSSRPNNDFFDRDDIIPLLRRLWKKLSGPTVAIKEKLDSIVEIVTNRSSHACDQALRKYTESVSRYPPPIPTDTYSEDMLRILDHKISYVRNLYDRMEAAQSGTHVACNKALTEVERLASTLRNELPPRPYAPPRPKPPSFPPRDCEEVQRSGAMTSGVYSIKPDGAKEKFSVYCDLRTDGGGWTVFQRRGDYGEPRQNFTLGWGAYKYGFGDLNEEFWLGNEKLHWLTSQDDVKLRVELEDFEETHAFAEYSRFRVLDESSEYQLNLGGYKGNASDSLSLHDGKLFSTFDRDNDEVSACCNCADTFKGGWWYYKCFEANLNGPYHSNPIDNGYFQGIIWEKWKGDYSLKSAEMKLRPLAFEHWKDP